MPVIETTKSEVTGVVTQQQIENVPVPTRQTLDLALLLPGTNTDGSVPRRVSVSVGAGGAVSQNAFLVDGVSNQQSTSGDPRQDFPQGGIREFRVNVSQASAEFGGTTGGVVTIVTKSGTNQFSGEAFEFFRDKSAQRDERVRAAGARHDRRAEARLPPEPERLHARRADRHEPGALPGRDRLDQDRSVDHRQHRQAAGLLGGRRRVSEQPVPADVLRAHRRPAQRRSRRSSRGGAGSATRSTCQSCGGTAASTAGSLVQQRRNSLVMGHDWVLSNRALNEFRFQWAPFAYLNNPSEASSVWTEVGDFAPERFAQMTPVYIFPSLTYGTTANKVQIETWWEFRDDFSITTSKGGNHSWKMGVASVRAPNTEDLTGNPLGHLDVQHRPGVQSEQSGDDRRADQADAVHRVAAAGRARPQDQPVPDLPAGRVAADRQA